MAELSLVKPESTQEAAQVNAQILRCPIHYLRERQGDSVLDKIVADAGLSMEQLSGSSSWISMRQLGLFFASARAVMRDDAEFREACTYRMDEGYGPLKFVLHAANPAAVLAFTARTMGLFTTVGRGEVVSQAANGVVLRYHSTVPELETGLICMSREATSARVPTFFGLPPAVSHKTKCLAHGDDCCEYEYRFFTSSRWLPIVGGGALGLALAWVLTMFGMASIPAWTVLPVVFALIGALIEMQRTYRGNLAFAEELRQAMQQLGEHEGEARREIYELHQRQRQWGQHLEEEVTERTATMQQVVDRLKALGERRIVNMRGFSHDLRNPLAVVMASIAYVRTEVEEIPECLEALDDCETSVRAMEKLLGELVATVQQERSLVRLTPEEMVVEPLADKLRRRMRALVMGRDIRVSVLKTREAPEMIHIDPLVFERVVDNLFTNAAKYTERGSIVIEIDGSPGFLTLKVSDSGRGIAPEDVKRIFRPEGSAPERRSQHSLGIGLSVVIRLLKQIGGRLEVMSKPGQGTTFWAHLPVDSREACATPPKTVPPQADDEVVAEVVTIRQAS